jgi:uncharacterized membrane-anchored protein YjiN (DUF445 family)
MAGRRRAMSTEVLAAIIGREAVEKMPREELAALVSELDKEILRDKALLAKLTSVVSAATERVHGRVSAS